MLFRILTIIRAAAPSLAAVAALASGAIHCSAQAIVSGGPAMAPTRLEVYGGYAYFHPLGGTIATRPYAAIQPGASGGVTGYLNRNFGVQVEAGASPMGPNDSVYTLEAGPVARYTYGRFSPFAHVLGGVARVRGPSLQPPTYGWGLTGGVGLDYVLPFFRRRIAIRPIQADYQFSHVDYGRLAADGLTGGLSEIKAYRISAGAVLRFGGTLPRERPLVYACSATPPEVFAGEPVTVTGSSTGPTTPNRVIYTWEVSGGRVAVTDDTAVITTTGLAPGNYQISGHISRGRSPEENASCTESFTVKAPVPPTISCSANPISVRPGGKATITSIASSEQNRPLRLQYSSSAGKIASSISIATLNTGDAPPGPITVECQVSDDLGQIARATATVNVSAPPVPVAQRRQLCSLSFERDRKRPVRVDNEAKACLDDVALALNRDATARLEITGESSAEEDRSQAAARASNASAYLVQEKGIDPARIDVKTGSASGRAAEIEMIPMGTAIRYSDAPAAPTTGPVAPSAGAAPGPAELLSTRPVTSGAAVPAPGYEGTGTFGPRRTADSLVLPPLPADAVAAPASRQNHKRGNAAKRHRRRKHSSRPASSSAVPAPAASGSNP